MLDETYKSRRILVRARGEGSKIDQKMINMLGVLLGVLLGALAGVLRFLD